VSDLALRYTAETTGATVAGTNAGIYLPMPHFLPICAKNQYYGAAACRAISGRITPDGPLGAARCQLSLHYEYALSSYPPSPA
jgi:hypothetical protein